MAKKKLTIKSILDGRSPTFFTGDSQFSGSVGIDPDQPIDGNGPRQGGSITPIKYADFSSTELNSAPMWFATSPKTSLVYTYLLNGKFISYSSALASETSIGTPTSGAGNGMAYYNNYIYLFTPTDVSRYGPLDGSPSLTNTVWTSTWSKTALTNTTYPNYSSVAYPNHAPHYHSANNRLYFCDFKEGIGYIHYIKTSKTTAEGDTDDGSTYNALDLPFGYMPTDIESYGTDLVISAIQTTNGTINQGKSALFFWDTSETSSFYRQIDIPEPLVSALINRNGVIYVFAGQGSAFGYSIYRYLGGNSLEKIDVVEDGHAPYAGGVENLGTRIAWGTTTTYPANSVSVMSLGSKNQAVKSTVLNNIIKSSSSGANGLISAIKSVNNASMIAPRLIVGWKDDSDTGIDAIGNATGSGVIRWAIQTQGKFTIEKIKLVNYPAIGATTSITPKIYANDTAYSTSNNLLVINNTNFSGKRTVELYPNGVTGEGYFEFELTFANTNITQSVLLPIEITYEENE